MEELEVYIIAICLEGILYVLYCGIFALYLRYAYGETRTIIFYAICLLFVLSTVTFVADLVKFILEEVLLFHSSTSDSRLTIFCLTIIQATASGCCDLLAQCILIYRCWIVWRDIRVVILPSILAITYLVTWIGTGASASVLQVAHPYYGTWGSSVLLTSFAASMAVNTLVTGLIVFKILKVFWEVRATSVERTLGSLETGARGTKLRHIIFIIIESGMALFAIQVVRVALYSLPVESVPAINGVNIVIGINQMFNGIAPTIILVRVAMRLSFDDEESFSEAAGSLPPSDTDTLQRTGSRNEDICLNDPPSDPNTHHQQVRSHSNSMPPQETRSASDDVYDLNTLPSWRMGSSTTSSSLSTSMLAPGEE